MNACVNNLRQIDGAIQQWALEHERGPADAVTAADITPYLKRGNDLDSIYCPQNPAQSFASSYTIVDVRTAPVCQQDAVNHVLP
jgi:hypothetical protein